MNVHQRVELRFAGHGEAREGAAAGVVDEGFEAPVSLLYPNRRHRSKRMQAFMA